MTLLSRIRYAAFAVMLAAGLLPAQPAGATENCYAYPACDACVVYGACYMAQQGSCAGAGPACSPIYGCSLNGDNQEDGTICLCSPC